MQECKENLRKIPSFIDKKMHRIDYSMNKLIMMYIHKYSLKLEINMLNYI
jgi:hypothetical protein